MCFNEQVSILAGSFGILCSFYLIYRGNNINSKLDIFTGFLLITISLMQFIEYVLWKNQKCNFANQMASFFIILVLCLQVLTINILYYILFPNAPMSKIFLGFFILFLLISIYIIKILYDNKSKICTFKDKNSCRLAWEPLRFLWRNNPTLLLIGVGLYFYLAKNVHLDDKISVPIGRNIIVKLTLAFAVLYAIYYKGINFFTIFGGVWCFLSVFLGPITILNI